MGVGRSGTATTSRILHTKLGVCMGHHSELEIPRYGQPNGCYEDFSMFEPTDYLISDRNIGVGKWLEAFEECHSGYNCKKPYIGTKQVRLARIYPKQLEAINPTLVIRTYRPKELVVDSLEKYRPPEREYWNNFYDVAESCMDRLERGTNVPFVIIEFGLSRRSDFEIRDEILTAMDLYL